jgi:hypothetical protein
MIIVSDDTGVPAPQVQNLFDKVDIDESVAACKSRPTSTKGVLPGLTGSISHIIRFPSRLEIGFRPTTWRKFLDTHSESQPHT